ncbi:ProQ activator of osmoprotectant transporter prop [Pseudomonas aeruginosa]|uniref:ProQ/FINO family protein n=1 Tax=Pseudomonas aeruginosa TaxID=287 RepID=UPI000F818317|nr:ProQ/FINO family protein [Pseudomonas aeruginosa]MBV5614700.1 ProQ activator of osmoprotectant transporter prop [Pseudomonas aeruginosa]MBV5906854.1 ProQ activator of osmoprotectant transporter prop [Pseudomonas aeruginosa]RTT13477.1 ProQ activator of osmoprotectant transporter prop [Pseudomonas aeruginosa]
MGFEQLAELRDRLRAENQRASTDTTGQRKRKPSSQKKSAESDPAVEAIWRLQRHFPLAFPVNPAPKVPLKEGILQDAEQQLQLLGISIEQLKLGIAAWCQGNRYWACMTANAPRFDLNGQVVGSVTASQALYARRQAKRQHARDQALRAASKSKARIQPDASLSTA